jgi:hypothetical protein
MRANLTHVISGSVPQDSETVESLAHYIVGLLDQDAHRETPHQATRPSVILPMQPMPSPRGENAKRLSHSRGDPYKAAPWLLRDSK